MSDSEEDKGGSYHVKRLKGQENYADWQFSVLSALLAKDLVKYLDEPPKTNVLSLTKEDIKFSRQYNKTYAILAQSLSNIVQSSLSVAARDLLNPEVKALWAELKASYSAI